MKVVITKASRRQLIQCWHLARTTKRAGLSEADIIEQHNDDIRRSLRRLNLKTRRRLRIARVQLRDSWWLRLGYREHGPIDLLRRQRQRQQARGSDQQMYHYRILNYDF